MLRVAALVIIAVSMPNGFVREMIYPAPAMKVPATPPAPLEKFEIKLSSDQTIVGWLQHNRAQGPVILYFHGNGENLETMRQSGLFRRFADLNVAFAAIDYPGYGLSRGVPSEPSIIKAAHEAVKYLHNRYSDRPLIACGWSLGAAVALQTAADRPQQIAGVIALSPWTSLPDIAKRLYPGCLVGSLVNERYDSVAASSKIRCPALVIHGEQDDLIPVEQGKEVSQALPTLSRFVSVREAAHNDLLSNPAVWETISDFVKTEPQKIQRRDR